MVMAISYHNKKVLVCGAARSGVSAALLLHRQGAQVTLQDAKLTAPPAVLANLGIDFYLGDQPHAIVTQFEVIVISPGIPYQADFLQQARAAGVTVIGEFELGAQHYTGELYAITGTNGKTTTTLLVSHLLAQVEAINTVGNIGTPITSVADPTLPCVAEVSSFQLETTDSFTPCISAVLNLTPDHLDRHGTMEHYAALKARIFENQTSEQVVILNLDNDYTRQMAQQTCARVYFFSTHRCPTDPEADVTYDPVKKLIIGKLRDGDALRVSVANYKLVGLHNIENAMVAVLIAWLHGLSTEQIEQGLASFSPPEHRLEYVREYNGTLFYNDSKATNPESAMKSIQSISEKPITLICGGVLKAVDHTPWATLVKAQVDQVILIGSPANQAAMMAELAAVGYTAVTLTEHLAQAVSLSTQVSKGTVLFSPATASFDEFVDYEDRGKQFKALVNNLNHRT